MQKADQIRITSDQNPRFIESIQNTPLGAKGKSEVHWTLKSRDVEGCDLMVDAVVPEGYELDPEAKDGSTIGSLGGSEALQTPLSMTVRKISKPSAGA